MPYARAKPPGGLVRTRPRSSRSRRARTIIDFMRYRPVAIVSSRHVVRGRTRWGPAAPLALADEAHEPRHGPRERKAGEDQEQHRLVRADRQQHDRDQTEQHRERVTPVDVE